MWTRSLGLHLWSQIGVGKIGIAPGPIMASSDYFKLVIRGKGGHGGAPHAAVDLVICAANMIQTVQTIQTREIDATRPTVITFCKIQCGSSPIIIPDKIELEGSIRCLHNGAAGAKERFRGSLKSVMPIGPPLSWNSNAAISSLITTQG